jgi:hypothetical protein
VGLYWGFFIVWAKVAFLHGPLSSDNNCEISQLLWLEKGRQHVVPQVFRGSSDVCWVRAIFKKKKKKKKIGI